MKAKPVPARTKPITFSVVINTCDRADPLRTLLYALQRQTYPHFEVIVVLGPTTDHSLAVIEAFAGRVLLERCPFFNLSMSRNIGIAAAAGEVIAFVDDDAVPAFTWLEQLAAVFANPDVTGAGGRVYLVHPEHGHLQFKFGLFSVMAEGKDVRDTPHELVITDVPQTYWYPRLMGANMAYRRQALLSVGGFDERFAYLFEEPDLAIRMGRSGYHIQPLAEAVVYHAPASSRNRKIFTWKFNYYAWMRGLIYFTLKNSSSVAGGIPALVKSLAHCIEFFQYIATIRQHYQLTTTQYRSLLKQLVKGVIWGFSYGLARSRHLLRPSEPSARSFQPFQVENSSNYPNIQPLPPLTTQQVQPMPEPPLRVCLLSDDYPPHSTFGIARLTHLLAQGLGELGHEVHVITQGRPDHTTFYDGAYVHEVKPLLNRYLGYVEAGYTDLAWRLNYSHAIHEQLQSLMINHRLQIVDSPLWAFGGLVTAVAGQMPVVVRLVTSMKQLNQIHTHDNQPEADLIGELESKLLDLSQGLIPISYSIKQTCQELYNIDFSDRTHQVIHAGIRPAPDADIIPLSGKAKAAPIVLFLGRLEKRKGILTLFEAIPKVLSQFPGTQFWLAGKDNSQYDGFASRENSTYPDYFLHQYPACAGQVKFLGHVPDSKLDALYQVCDLFVAPSLFESFGLIFLEAMNQARPAIGCNVGGPSEIVADQETGLLVAPECATELAEAIIRLLSQPQRMREMGLAGRERLLKEFTYTRMAEEFVKFYRKLLQI